MQRLKRKTKSKSKCKVYFRLLSSTDIENDTGKTIRVDTLVLRYDNGIIAKTIFRRSKIVLRKDKIMKSRLYAGLEISFCLFIFFAAFGSTANCGPNTVPVEPNRVAEIVPETDIAVTINGVDITESDVDVEVAQRLRRMRMPPKMPPQFIEQYKKQIRQPALEDLITRVLVDEKIKAEVVVTEEEITAYLEKMGSAQRPPLSLEDIKEQIRASGQNFDDVEQNIRRRLGSQKLMEAQWAGRINITEDDARKYYDENPRLFETPEQVRASHILIKPDTSDPNADPNEAKAKAHELLKQIQNAADFATLAKANSACPSAARGGDLGLKPRGTWVKPFEEAAFKLKVGQVSDVVETQFGYHIIKLPGRKEPTITMFEEARDGIINALTRKKRDEITKEYIELLKAKANIVYPPGKEPKATIPIVRPARPTPADSNATAKPQDTNAVE